MEDNRFKQRLVGAIVLVSLGVIFIPMILSGGDPAKRDPASTIPAKPEREFVSRIIPVDKQAPEPEPIVDPRPEPPPEPKPEPKPEKAEGKTASAPEPAAVEPATPEPKAEAAVAEKPATVAKSEAPAPRMDVPAWVVQLGSFDSKDNAYSLRDKLRDKGFSAFVDSVEQKGKTTYRVRIGPEVKREKADELLASVKKVMKTEGFVTRYP